ncbi:MAG: DNA polymerase III subunit [Elusimicrobiota bacterium]
MAFSSILGQDKTIKRLRSLVETGRVPPAMIFHGPPGVGKFPAALEFAAALNCTRVPFTEAAPAAAEGPADGLFFSEPELKAPAAAARPPEGQAPAPAGDSCGLCRSCLQAKSGAHPDIRVVDTLFQAALLDEDESANLKVDTVRELTRWAQQKPMLSDWKIFVIRDAEALVPQAQNALLKTLEAPPPNTVIVLTTSKKNSLLATILSRSFPVEFAPLPRAVVAGLLAARGADPAEARKLAALSRGSMEKAAEAGGLMLRLAKLRPGDPSRAFKFAAGLPRDSHLAREEVKTLLELALGRIRAAWRAAEPPAKNKFTALLRRTLELRRMADRNVSYYQLLEVALLESERAGLRLEDLLDTAAAEANG